MKKCPECSSLKILEDVKANRLGYGFFELKAQGKPDAMFRKDSVISNVRAEVWVDCGYAQFMQKTSQN